MKKGRSRYLAKVIVFTFVILITLVAPVLAKNLYVSTTGSDSVTYANNSISAPWATWSMAYSSAQAGDTVYFRAGTYTISSTINGDSVGHDGSSGAHVYFYNYPGEQVTVNVTAGVGFYWSRLYHEIVGLDSSGSSDSASARNKIDFEGTSSCNTMFWIGTNLDGSYAHFKNVKIVVGSGGDNTGCIMGQANRWNYTIIEYCTLVGNSTGTTNNAGCIFQLGGSNIGCKFLHNDISGPASPGALHGIHFKHNNGDTSLSSGAEVAYNYVHGISNGDVYGNPLWYNIHDNLFADGVIMGDNGGGVQGHNNTWNHNTFIGSYSQYGGSQDNVSATITNNIMTSITTESGDSGGYNMYTSHAAIWTGDLGNTSPTYVGGSDPIAKYALPSSSAGHLAGSDGLDMGANISLVGPGASQQTTNTTPPATPTGVTVTIIQ